MQKNKEKEIILNEEIRIKILNTFSAYQYRESLKYIECDKDFNVFSCTGNKNYYQLRIYEELVIDQNPKDKKLDHGWTIFRVYLGNTPTNMYIKQCWHRSLNQPNWAFGVDFEPITQLYKEKIEDDDGFEYTRFTQF